MFYFLWEYSFQLANIPTDEAGAVGCLASVHPIAQKVLRQINALACISLSSVLYDSILFSILSHRLQCAVHITVNTRNANLYF